MQKEQPDLIEQLIVRMLNKDPDKASEPKEIKKAKKELGEERTNQQIEQLDISDYLQLLAHQKKHISHSRWNKLHLINQSGFLEQQDFKYLFSLACQAHFRRLEHPGYFKLLTEMRKAYPLAFFSPIEKDVPRTLNLNHPFLEPLKNILTAYAIRNPSLVYCQGMNYLVAYFLINEVSSEQTFWILACLIENCLPEDYFKDLTTISIVTCIVEDVLIYAIPQFQEVLQDAGMDISVILVPWLVCLFSKGFTNSVSAYLITYFMLQSKHKKPGMVLLKISLSILSVVLEKDNQLPYSKDFKTLKDALELYVYGISLSDIKVSLKETNIEEEAYCELQNFYRKQKMEARSNMLRNRSRKMALPPCNKSYPVCFHRIQIQKKLGALENALILKNGLTIEEQIIENYLQEPQDDETAQISYLAFEQCQVGRQEHVCHLNQNESHSKVDPRGQPFQREMTHRIELIEENQSLDQSVQIGLQLSTYEQRFKEVSDYFVVDQQYLEEEEDNEDRQCEQELQKQFQEFSKEKALVPPAQSLKPQIDKNARQLQEQKDKKGFKAILNKVFRRASDLIFQLQKSKESRRSRTSFQSPKKRYVNAFQS